MRILVLEDDPALARLLEKQLTDQSHLVEIVSDVREVPDMVMGGYYDLVVLDLMAGVGADLSVLEAVRTISSDIPVILISGSTDVSGRIEALNRGADDVLVKPFAVKELVARVQALLRRASRDTGSVLRVQDLELDRVNRTVSRSGRQIDLTPKEFSLLEYLMLNSGQRVTRAMIAREVWNFSPDATTNVVEVYINYVRKKIDTPSAVKLIHTIRGVGYQIGDPSREKSQPGASGRDLADPDLASLRPAR